MTAILITGGAGFVGSHTCKRLHAVGYTPITFDNLSRGHEAAVRWGPLERGDLLDPAALKAAFAKWRPTGVMHFAALAYVGESFERPLSYHLNNVSGTLNLLAAMEEHDCKRMVFSSSCATYGAPAAGPIVEATPQRPINPYGSTKLAAEIAIQEVAAARGISYVILRYFNAAGSDPDGEIGEAHEPETHLLPIILRAAGRADAPIHILGDDYPTPDGTCIRDYVHVWDLAQAHVLALRRVEQSERVADVFNLGTGRGYSIREVIAAAERVTGETVYTKISARRLGDPPILVCDPSKAMGELGWTPKRSTLELELGDAWAYLKSHR